jgi:hypothetical protein
MNEWMNEWMNDDYDDSDLQELDDSEKLCTTMI